MTRHNQQKNLQDAFIYTEKSLQAKLEHAFFPDHPVAKGDVAEDAWRKFLINFLPSRYKVGSGFVIDSNNHRSEQIDCIIYDNIYTPTLWGEENYIYIPVEAVHAVFEIKQEVKREYLQVASDKIKSVRKLYRTSATYVGSGQENPPKELFHIIGGLLATRSVWKYGLMSTHAKDAVQKIHNNHSEENSVALDIILTARHGFIDYFNTGFPCDSPPHNDKNEGAVTRGIFRLIKALVAQGTVTAIDLKKYEDNCFG